MILTKTAIFGFILIIANSKVAGQTVLYAPLIGDKCYDVCTSRECNDAASTILNNMDPDIKPCIDFYKFACGGFDEKGNIPTYVSRYNMLEAIHHKINEDLRGFLEANIEPNETKPFTLVKTFYKSCLNTTSINLSWHERVREILKKLGDWPVVVGDRWDENKFNWDQAMAKFREIGDHPNYFFDYKIIIDPDNNKQRILVLSPPPRSSKLGFRNYGVNSRMNEDDFTQMSNLAIELAAEPIDPVNELRETYNFETELYDIIPSSDESPDANKFRRTTVAKINGADAINDFLPSGIRVDDNDIILIKGVSYFQKFGALTSKTSKRVLANYIFRKFVKSASNLMVLPENPWRQPRWEKCVVIVQKKLPRIVGAMYVREYVTNKTRSNVEKIITEIMGQLNDTLTQASWMNEETRKAAIERATAMNIRVGYPDELFDDISLEEYHANLTFTEGNYFGNMFNVSSFIDYNNFNVLRKPIVRTDWGGDATVTRDRAFYIKWINAFRIGADILRDIYYGNDRPEYLNYGAIGTVIGHEIGHGFEAGIDHDKDGNIVLSWDTTTDEKYLERVDCITEQYSNYTIKGIGPKVNVPGVLSELIADNIGIKLAHRAYVSRTARKLQSSKIDEPRLNGLEKYSPAQMFWISFANNWCERTPEEPSVSSPVSVDVHPVAEYRVIGQIMNMPEFANYFECSKVLKTMKVSSRMIPEKRCSIL